ncbi:glutamate-gated chloride channel-like [Schistocerca nitens]|uniref:glutamate-gated chloride channel-like n=1 Tax=Schistocerca nitens TaxID=7011 RepID=UPI00211991CB|nr:glutamate-gated chloride channel-like [Schistocerca nitens]
MNGELNHQSLQQEMQTLELLLRPDRYDPQVRPPGITGANPTIVRVNLFVRTLTKFDDQNMEFETQITFKEQWTDARLKFNDLGGKLKYLTLTDTKRIWIPDVFFVNEKKAYHHNVVTPNVYIRIFSYGTVLFSTRISMTLSCPMDLRRYPHDVQVCSLMMGSYGWKTDDVVLLWKDGDPVQIMSNLHLSLFTLEKFLTDYCNTATTTGDYSCLKVELLLRREFNYYMIHVYLPSCMLVIMSWASFWLDRGDTASRLSLVVAALLVLAVQVSRVYASVPQVAYTMAIDVWIGGCFTFVFTALLESTLVSHASRSDLLREMKERDRSACDVLEYPDPALLWSDGSTTFTMIKECEIQTARAANCCCCVFLAKFPSRATRIDIISRITFPIAFTLFNCFYWYTYLFTEEEP